MDNKVYERIALVFTAVAALAYVINLILTAPALRTNEAAAWVQAVGSIAAIAGAYFVGERQAMAAFRNDLKIRKIELQQRKNSFLAIAAAAAAQADRIAHACTLNDAESRRLRLRMYNTRTTSDIINSLAAVPMHELGSYDAVSAFFRIKDGLSTVDRMYSDYLSILEGGNEEDQQAVRRRDLIVNLVKDHCGIVIMYFQELREAFDATTLPA
jgi:hypothetical protein